MVGSLTEAVSWQAEAPTDADNARRTGPAQRGAFRFGQSFTGANRSGSRVSWDSFQWQQCDRVLLSGFGVATQCYGMFRIASL